MSKAEEKTTEIMKKAKDFIPDGGYSEKELNLAFFMFIKGYHQAEKDLEHFENLEEPAGLDKVKLMGMLYESLSKETKESWNKFLQEEPVNKVDVDAAMAEVEAKAKTFTESHKGESSDEILAKMRGEEPVSEDLKTELNKYIKDHFTIDKEQLDRFSILEKDYMYSMDKSDMLALVEHFTNWQKQKDSIVSEDLEKASKEWLEPQLDKSYVSYGEDKMMELTHFDGYAMLDAIEFGAKWQEQKDMVIFNELAELANHQDGCYALENIQMRLNGIINED